MIRTERLLLRGWREEDVAGHHALIGNAGFMTFLGAPLPIEESVAAAARQNACLAATGSCFWAVEEIESGNFVGYCGIKPGPPGTPIADLPEIGWGIAPSVQRRGYAREAASACIADGWARYDWPAIFAITVPLNVASRAVMERIGMHHAADRDFDHPALGEDDPLRRHVTYVIDRPA